MSDGEPIWRRMPPVVLGFIAVIVAAFLAASSLAEAQQNAIYYALAIIPARFDEASVYHFTAWYEPIGPLLGHVFLHAGWLHLGMNMLVFMQAAPFVASRLGAGRFLALFFGSAVGAAIAYIVINAHAETPAVGASGAVCGVFGAYFLSVRRSWREALADPQVRNAGFSFLFINVFLAGLASVSGFLPIAWEAHLGGFVAGGALYPLLARRAAPGPWS
jgi:membrane associated rhomboid family serine protease